MEANGRGRSIVGLRIERWPKWLSAENRVLGMWPPKFGGGQAVDVALLDQWEGRGTAAIMG